MFSNLRKLVVASLAVVTTSTLLSMQLLGQIRNDYTEVVPLTYTLAVWEARSLSASDTEGDELLTRGAHRSDGSWVRETFTTEADGSVTVVRSIFDLEAARYTILDGSVNSSSTMALSENRVENSRGKRPACAGETVSTVLGYDVILTTQTPEIPLGVYSKHGQVRAETLIAPELGCLEMDHKLIITYADGTERTIRSKRVIDVIVEEPDDERFAVPDGYVEMSPVQRFSALGAQNLDNDQFVQHLERSYQNQRPQ